MTREKWFRLPLELRRRWWRDTDYGKRAPPPEMIAALNKARDGDCKGRTSFPYAG